ncbi:uncharacterized protein LOC110715719 isoform X2 [Chenopodium quinoa]|uniref:uncharacterized protein LOC110715719 isoform X2 n=1 Tax=Chenopodium quinoa TaxID=63459 RepID=UPI000B7822A0|nr:uncharacterized protein LOC110715719 isoform X2 [Chenopodium quinoa]
MITTKGKRSRRSTAPRKTQINWENSSVLNQFNVQSRNTFKLTKDDCNSPPATVRISKDFRVIMSDPEDKDIDSRSAACWESYTIIAINSRNDNPSDYELVETGPVGIGYLSSGSRILHFNFKVKIKGVSDVQTFFTELTETKINDVRVDHVVCMGPSNLLPEKADTRGCLCCYPQNIHHPEYSMLFRNGGEDHWKTLCSKIDEVHDYLWRIRRKNKKDVDLSLKFSDTGLEYVGETCDCSDDRRASVALRLFNKEQGSNFELVKISGFKVVNTSIGFLMHMNFEAKEEPGVEVKTFFAEVICCGYFFLVDFCKCLGPSNHLPDEANLRGCCYCTANIHHPLGPGYIIGRELGTLSYECED